MKKRLFRYRCAACFALALANAAMARAEDLGAWQARLDSILVRQAACGAVLHARVIELPAGREIYARRAAEPCTPASNFKLLTSAAGLDMFGPDYVFETRLLKRGDDLWVIGCGDPGTGDYRLARARGEKPTAMLDVWAKALESRGIKQIAGDLVYDDTALEELRVHPTWPKSWLLHWYAAPVAGLNFNDNSIDVTVFPAASSQPAGYEVMPPVPSLKFTNECISGAGAAPTIRKLVGGNSYKLGGGCTKKAELMSQPIEDPGRFFAEALRTQLAVHGITIQGKIRRAKWTYSESESTVIATHRTPIRDVLARINKNSQNMFAECLCKMTGRRYEQLQGRSVPGSWESGGKALRAFLKQIHVDDKVLQPMDGSGLSPQNRTSALMLTSVLMGMYGRPDRDAYWQSLSVNGVDGSLKDRMKSIKCQVRGKTGYIGGVSSCTGYIHTRTGTWLAYSFVYNGCPQKSGPPEDEQPFMDLQDEACVLLANWPELEQEDAKAQNR